MPHPVYFEKKEVLKVVQKSKIIEKLEAFNKV